MGILSIFNTNKERGEDFLKELIICVKNTYYSQPKKKKELSVMDINICYH